MARTIIDSTKVPLLPPGMVEFIKRRLKEGAGLALMALAAAFFLALASYTPGDPSINSATDGAAANLMGVGGAYTADLFLQLLGLAGAIPGLGLAAWGWRIAHKDAITRFWLRAPAGICSMILIATSLSLLPAPGEWPLVTGLGGALGALITENIATLTKGWGVGLGPVLIGGTSGVLGLAALVFALGLTRTDSKSVWRAMVRSAILVLRGYHWGRGAVEGLATRRERIEPILTATFGPPLDFEDGDFEDGNSQDRPPPPRGRRAVTAARPGLVAPKAPNTKTGRRAKAQRQGRLKLGLGSDYDYPPLDLLQPSPPSASRGIINQESLKQNALMLAGVLEDFGVRGEIVKVRPGPVVTLYELAPAPGTKTSRVIGLSDDIARSMSAVSVRVAVAPGRNVIGIELPNAKREMVHLRELLASEKFERASGKLTLAVGKDISGAPVLADLARMPHLLIAGTTGSGKSVGINTMILSLLYQLPPDECKFIMIDPKMLELSVYDGIPHLMAPVVTDPSKAITALKWGVREMEERYRAMSHLGVRNITGYNNRLAEAAKKGETLTRRVQTGFDEDGKPVTEDQPLSMEPLSYIIVVVDEMADLMMVAGKEIEATVQRLAQMARAAGIHLIMATQRPSVDVITGTIKANFPTRISFQVTSKIDSRTILGEQGAEQLLGHGDMLYMEGGGRVTRVHCPFVSDEEVEEVVRHLKAQGEPDYVEEVTEEVDDMIGGLPGGGPAGDALYDQAVALVAREGKASTSFIQRHLQIGYNRAARIIETMEKEGVVSKANRVGRREVLIGSH